MKGKHDSHHNRKEDNCQPKKDNNILVRIGRNNTLYLECEIPKLDIFKQNEQEEFQLVLFPDAVVHPRTVMVEVCNTSVTLKTMPSP